MNAPASPEEVAGASNDWTGAVIRFSSHAKMTNEIQICFSKWCENEKRNSNPFFKVMRKRKTKFISVFQSDAKTKNENWNWYPFFKVMRKRKTKYEVQNHFSKLGENEKQKAKFKSVYQCHAKTKNGYGTWIPFSHAIEKRLALRYTHCFTVSFLMDDLQAISDHPMTYNRKQIWL